MIKFLSISDFHYLASQREQCEKNGQAIAEAAKKHNVDMIISAGDFWDRGHYNSDKDGIKTALKIMKSWTDICAVSGIYGTKSHDSPGSMSIFPMFRILEPYKVWGLVDGRLLALVNEIQSITPWDCLIFGLPEVDKNNIMSVLNITAEEANAKAEELYIQYFDQFIAPMRLKYPDIPAVFVGHGNFSDSRKENTSDIIMKSSDIVIHTEDLRGAEIDYFCLGHIHQPKQFKNICGGYVGSWGMSWNELDFVPGFNLVEIDDNKKVTVTRIPYGTPMRKKVILPFTDWKPDIAYKIVTKDPDYKMPENIHSWSELEFKPEEIVTQRVTQEEADKVNQLFDWFKLIDPTVKPRIKELVDTIPDSKKDDTKKNISVSVKYGEVDGCVLFHDKKIVFDIEDLPKSMINLTGENGDSKSSIVGALCHPYPIIIGKQDLENKRPSPVLKEFFDKSGSRIYKKIDVNGIEHEHIINIKAAHTDNPKVECYLNIAGKPQLTLNTFDEMFEKCEDLYGSFKDYLITTFNVQPQQTDKAQNLMNAKMTTIRDIVQKLANVSRDDQRRFALDMKADLDTENKQLEVILNLMKDNLSDPKEVKSDISNIKNLQKELTTELKEIKTKGTGLKADLEKLRESQVKNNAQIAEKKRLEQSITDSENKIKSLESEKSELSELIEELEILEKMVDEHDKNQSRIAELEREQNGVDKVNNKSTAEYNELLANWNIDKQEISGKDNAMLDAAKEKKAQLDQEKLNYKKSYNDDIIDYNIKIGKWNGYKLNIESERKEFEQRKENIRGNITQDKKNIESLNKPCEFCGKISTTLRKDIQDIHDGIKIMEANLLTEFVSELLELSPEPKQPEETPFPKEDILLRWNDNIDNFKMSEVSPEPAKPTPKTFDATELNNLKGKEYIDIEELKSSIEKAKTGQNRIIAIIAECTNLKASIEINTTSVSNIIIDDKLDREIISIGLKKDTLLDNYHQKSKQSAIMDQQLKSLAEKLDKIKDDAEQVKTKSAELKSKKQLKSDWNYIAGMLAPSKIPALELELIISDIDKQATKNLESFLDGRCSIKTVTQIEGKKKTKDEFNILIHDSQTGKEKSFMKWSPGERSFPSDAYVKALVKKRIQRSNIKYSPIILDEIDGPICTEWLGMFYQMQYAFYKDFDNTIITITHNPETKQFIDHSVSAKGLRV